ncbi:MAG: hypothetical protein K8R37_10700 [Bacteroidales bacterium]|nr:hypothetical protein [Bacteroidales bacterium]
MLKLFFGVISLAAGIYFYLNFGTLGGTWLSDLFPTIFIELYGIYLLYSGWTQINGIKYIITIIICGFVTGIMFSVPIFFDIIIGSSSRYIMVKIILLLFLLTVCFEEYNRFNIRIKSSANSK